MSLIRFPGANSASSHSPEHVHPCESEGVSFNNVVSIDPSIRRLEQEPLPTFPLLGIDVKAVRRRKDLDNPHAQFYERELELSDGTKFKDYTGITDNPINPWPVVKVPAWWTDPINGFNKRTTDKLNALGRHTHTVGIPENKPASLYHNAWMVHLAIDSAGVEFGADLDTAIIDQEGDSNGAITSHGVMAYAPDFERTIRDAYLVDQCLMRPIGKPDVIKFFKHPDYGVRELYCLARQIKRMAQDDAENIRDYVGTISFTPQFLVGNLLLARQLFWGEQGHLVAHIPDNQRSHDRLFSYSIANQKQYFAEVLRGSSLSARPGMTFDVITGTHMSIANPRIVDDKVTYIARIDRPDFTMAA